MTVKTLPMILGALLALGACGQTGPLYLEKSDADVAAETVAGEATAGESVTGAPAAESEKESDGTALESAVKE